MSESEPTNETESVEQVVERSKELVEKYAGKAAKYDGEKGSFFAGIRAAHAGIIEKFGDESDFEEALLRGSHAEREQREPSDLERKDDTSPGGESP